jgi:hypothetical protein
MLIFNLFLLENRFRPREKIMLEPASRNRDFRGDFASLRGVPLNSWIVADR